MTDDSDKRPEIFVQAGTKSGEITISVQGAEGEDADDIEDIATRMLEDTLTAQKSLDSDEYNGKEHQ